MMRLSSTLIARVVASAVILGTIFGIFLIKSDSSLSQHAINLSGLKKPKGSHGSTGARARAKAGNGTLGFNSIQFINMKSRFDRLDALSIQAYLSGLEVMEAPGVEPDMIKDVGMPPTRSADAVRKGEKGSWRAHANIWASMLRNNLSPVLILESDAAWDVNIREIMGNLNPHFTQFLKDTNATKLRNPGWNAASRTTDDPWMSDHWDVLSFGHCHERNEPRNISTVYPDPHVPPGKEYGGRTLGRERLIRRTGGFICTTAYAISQTGAAKMLVRTATKLDAALDLTMGHMMIEHELVGYTVGPPIVAQWQYVSGIGMDERGANSDINGAEGEDETSSEEAWKEVEESGNVWTTKSHHEEGIFEDMALQSAWRKLFMNS